jgi:hypothetical protein
MLRILKFLLLAMNKLSYAYCFQGTVLEVLQQQMLNIVGNACKS